MQALHCWHIFWSNNLGTGQIPRKRQLHGHHLASFSLSFLGLPCNDGLHKPSRLSGGNLRAAATSPLDQMISREPLSSSTPNTGESFLKAQPRHEYASEYIFWCSAE